MLRKFISHFNKAASFNGYWALPDTQLSECRNSHIQSNWFSTDFLRSWHLLNDFLEIRLKWLENNIHSDEVIFSTYKLSAYNHRFCSHHSTNNWLVSLFRWPQIGHTKSWQLIVIVTTHNNFCLSSITIH